MLFERLKNKFNELQPYSSYFLGGLLLILIIALIWLQARPNDVSSLSDGEKENLLSEIAKNTPKSVFFKRLSTNVNTVPSVVDDISTSGINKYQIETPIPVPQFDDSGNLVNSADFVAPNLDLYNYRKTTRSFTAGPRSCLAISYPNPDYEISFTEFFESNRSYYKYYIESVSGELVETINIAKIGNDINEEYKYMGGEFIATTYYPIYESFTNEYELESVNREYYDGYEIDFVDAFEENGVRYLVTEYSYNLRCDEEDLDTSNIIVRNTIRLRDYAQVSSDIYVGRVSNSNLLFSESIDSLRRSVQNFNTIESEFTLPDKDEVIIDRRNLMDLDNDYQIEANKYLRSLSVSLVSQGSTIPNMITGNTFPPKVPNEDYFLRRDFYPDNSNGSNTFNTVVKTHNSFPYVSYSLNNVWDSTYVSIYKAEDKSALTLLDDISTYSYSPISIDISIGTEVISAFSTAYRVKNNLPSSYPTSYPSSYPSSNQSELMQYPILIFEYEGFTYLLHASTPILGLNFIEKTAISEEQMSPYSAYSFYLPF